jgi:hypothetical protein
MEEGAEPAINSYPPCPPLSPPSPLHHSHTHSPHNVMLGFMQSTTPHRLIITTLLTQTNNMVKEPSSMSHTCPPPPSLQPYTPNPTSPPGHTLLSMHRIPHPDVTTTGYLAASAWTHARVCGGGSSHLCHFHTAQGP